MIKTIDLTDFIQAFIALCAAVITTFIIPWIKAKLSLEQQRQLNNWIQIAVRAAEQIYMGVGRGEEKLNYVIEYLESKGFTVDKTMIEAAVNSLCKTTATDKTISAEFLLDSADEATAVSEVGVG